VSDDRESCNPPKGIEGSDEKKADYQFSKVLSAFEKSAIKSFTQSYDQISASVREMLQQFHHNQVHKNFQIAGDLAGALDFSSRFKTLGDEMVVAQKGYLEAIRAVTAVAPLLQQIRRSLPQIFDDATLARDIRERNAALAAGILPHGLIPWEELDLDMEPRCLCARICDVTTSNWDEISSRLEEKVAAYNVNEESKFVLREALSTHQNGLHRATVRLIMPEIERMVRFHFGDERVDDTWIAKAFLKDVAELPVGMVMRIERGLDMFMRLHEHLYAKLKTAELVEEFADDPIPNRHAALHGLIPYNRVENSLNAVFMFDFLMELVSVSIPYSSKHE
jgi:hypothetical protein